MTKTKTTDHWQFDAICIERICETYRLRNESLVPIVPDLLAHMFELGPVSMHSYFLIFATMILAIRAEKLAEKYLTKLIMYKATPSPSAEQREDTTETQTETQAETQTETETETDKLIQIIQEQTIKISEMEEENDILEDRIERKDDKYAHLAVKYESVTKVLRAQLKIMTIDRDYHANQAAQAKMRLEEEEIEEIANKKLETETEMSESESETESKKNWWSWPE